MDKIHKIVFSLFLVAVVVADVFLGRFILNGTDPSYSFYVFILFIFISILIIIAAAWSFFNVQKLSVEKIFIVFFTLIGLSYVISVPFPNATDESAHLLRLYEISQGHFVSAQNNEAGAGAIGRQLPQNLNFSPDSYKGVLSNLSVKISNQNAWLYFPNTASASFAAYAPYLPGLYLAKSATRNFFAVAYLTRIFTFIFAGILLFLALKIIPFKKNLLFILICAPIIFRALTAISGDMTLNVLSFCLVALLFYYLTKLQTIQNKHIVLFAGLILFLSLCKTPVYSPFVLLFFILPQEKFKSTKVYFIWAAIIMLITILADALWLQAIKEITDSYALAQNKNAGGNYQIKYILTHPFSFSILVLKTYILHFVQYVGSYVGIGWGYINQKINFVLVFLYMFAVAVVAISEKTLLSVRQQIRTVIVFFVIIISVMALTAAAQFIRETSSGANVIQFILGRYFAPLILLFFMAFGFDIFKISKAFNKFNSQTIFAYALLVLFFIHLCVIAGNFILFNGNFYLTSIHFLERLAAGF